MDPVRNAFLAPRLGEDPTSVGSGWSDALEFASDEDKVLLLLLAEIPEILVPESGLELADEIPADIAWEEQRIAAVKNLGASDV